MEIVEKWYFKICVNFDGMADKQNCNRHNTSNNRIIFIERTEAGALGVGL